MAAYRLVYDSRSVVCVTVCLHGTLASPAKTVELIEMPLKPCIRWNAHWRHLANTVGSSVTSC